MGGRDRIDLKLFKHRQQSTAFRQQSYGKPCMFLDASLIPDILEKAGLATVVCDLVRFGWNYCNTL